MRRRPYIFFEYLFLSDTENIRLAELAPTEGAVNGGSLCEARMAGELRWPPRMAGGDPRSVVSSGGTSFSEPLFLPHTENIRLANPLVCAGRRGGEVAVFGRDAETSAVVMMRGSVPLLWCEADAVMVTPSAPSLDSSTGYLSLARVGLPGSTSGLLTIRMSISGGGVLHDLPIRNPDHTRLTRGALSRIVTCASVEGVCDTWAGADPRGVFWVCRL